ncbi:F0F1 ATP synthase subunit beta [Mycoplasma sp. 1654_15]|nr:F0F1 ATP synthase subunit beta [Mycoplasma sp. 1654_15]
MKLKILAKYKELEDVILILGFDELDKESKIIVKKLYNLKTFSHKTSSWLNTLQRKKEFLFL